MAQTHERSLTSSQVLKLHAQGQCLACPYLPGLAVTHVFGISKGAMIKTRVGQPVNQKQTVFVVLISNKGITFF